MVSSLAERNPHNDLLIEAEALLRAASEAGLLVRLTGGVAVGLTCPSARRSPLQRAYKDIDLVGPGRDRDAIDDLLQRLGYEPNREFNLLQGHSRLLYWDSANSRQLDVFLDRIVMCHELDVLDRLRLDDRTLTPADLLLTKLQVVETNERDLKDATALLVDHVIDASRIAAVLAADWGWWRTATRALDRVELYATSLSSFYALSLLGERVRTLTQRIDAEPKSLRWKARSRLGERVRWYELPEELA